MEVEGNFRTLSARYHYADGIYESSRLAEHARWVVDQLRTIKYDFVAVTGKSGMSVAFAALAIEPFNLVTVRKGESTHGDMIEGNAPRFHRYVILDDFISLGETIRRIHEELAKLTVFGGFDAPQCVGALLYRDRSFRSAQQLRRYLPVGASAPLHAKHYEHVAL